MPVLEQAVAEAGLADRVEILATTCRNRCDYGPSLNVYPGPVFYNEVDAEAIRDAVLRVAGQETFATFRITVQRSDKRLWS